jgi:hypothetical protein
MLTPALCACGCLQPMFEGDNWRDGLLFNHTPAKRIPNTPSYLILDMGYDTPCWVWQACLNKWGYAKIKRGGKTQGGHRLFYRAYVDLNLPPSRAGSDGLDHLCRIRKCVNYAHLEPTTNAENIRRGELGKLSPDVIGMIRSRALAGENQKAIALDFDISQSHVSEIKNGHHWSAASTRA